MKLTDKQVEEFEKESQAYMDYAKEKIKKIANEAIDDIYINIVPNAYGDALTNFRNSMMEEIVKTKPSKFDYQGSRLRELIWKSHKDELVNLLNEDLLKENERLKKLLEDYQNPEDDYMRRFV
jgi:hypothetical protein